MIRRLRAAALVAAFDMSESLRSRKVLGLLIVYVAGAIASTAGFVSLLETLEKTLADQLRVATTSKPGTMTRSIQNSEEFRRVIAELTGDASLVDAIAGLPPLALFYGWMALTFVPALIVFTSCDAISNEVGSGSARYALLRTDRLSWAVGKLGGQAMLMAIGVAAGALGTWMVGLVGLASFEGGATAWWMLRLGGRAWVYGLPYLGLALGISQMVRSSHAARALALVALTGLGAGRAVLKIPEVLDALPVLAPSLGPLFPGNHALDLWRPTVLERGPAMVMLVALCATYFAVGHLVFDRRDA